MNAEFHYYVVHCLASEAGLRQDMARIVAYSSQFVDDNVVGYTIDTERGVYQTAITQNYGWWDTSFPREVYLPFHFFPGGDDASDTTRADGGRNPFSCIANSSNVRNLLIRALKTRNPYRVGIALHTFADSWAHQNFSGRLEEWNAVAEDSPVPAIGHAQALTAPDEITATWSDPRLTQAHRRIDNRERFRQAATKIYKYLCVFNRRPFDDADAVVENLLGRYFSPAGTRSDEERVLDLIIEGEVAAYDRKEWLREAVAGPVELPGEEWFGGYSVLLWLKDALLHRTRLLKRDRLASRTDFFQSHLYRWNEAAKEHGREAQALFAHLSSSR